MITVIKSNRFSHNYNIEFNHDNPLIPFFICFKRSRTEKPFQKTNFVDIYELIH